LEKRSTDLAGDVAAALGEWVRGGPAK